MGERASQGAFDAIVTFRKCFGELASSVDSLFDVRLRDAQGRAGNVDPDWVKGLRKTVCSAEGDDLGEQVETAKNELISSLRTYLR